MAKVTDVEIIPLDRETLLWCKACKTIFAKWATSETFRLEVEGTLRQKVDALTAKHLEVCKK